MKKLLFTLSLLFSVFMIQAQVVSVQGTVTNTNGTGVPNVPVVISNPILGGGFAVGWAVTDNNGDYYWVDTIGGFPLGIVGTADISITDCNGATLNQMITFTPNMLALTANFTYCANGGGGNCYLNLSPITTNGNNLVMSANLSGGISPSTYFWDMGDGTTYSSQAINHTYAAAGTYYVYVGGIDATGCIDSTSFVVTTTGSGGGNCLANMSYFPDSTNYLTQYFNAISLNGVAPFTYAWDFGDGNTATTQSPIHTYALSGTYIACVTVTDANGCSVIDCQPVVAVGGSGGNCQAIMSYLIDAVNPLSIDFSVQTSAGTAYTYVWDFGDGNTSTLQYPNNTYTQSGTYNVCVTATDANGCTVTDCQQVIVYAPCTTSFTSSPNATNPNTYTFTSANTGNSNMLYYWEFGDGIINNTTNLGTITHTYAQANSYYVTLVEVDLISGCMATYTDVIFVGTPSPCQAAITYNNVFGSLTVDFFGTSTGTAPFTYAWDFGDNNTSNVQNPTHTYNTMATGPVIYNVTLTVTDANGCTSTVTETVLLFSGNGSGQISGYLWKDTTNFTPADGLVYLIEYDSINGSLTAIDTVQTQQGFFQFQNVPMGLYLVKAALLPTDADYANYLPTYFIQSLSWANAQYYGPAPFGLPSFIDIQLIQGNNPGGPGFIGGLVVNGAGRPVTGDVTLVEEITNMEPMEGVSVLLLDANNNAVTHTVTGADGSYSFSNIAMGIYNVHVEEVGKITFNAEITVDAANLNHDAVHFTVHDNMVTTTGVYDIANVESFQVFPNPVSGAANVQVQLNESMDATLTVTNLMGQTMINQNVRLNAGDNTFAVEMSDLPAGLYLLSLKSDTDIITYKVQKQ